MAQNFVTFQLYSSILAYIEIGNQFEVLNKHGRPIFFAIDATEYQGIVFEGSCQPFNLMLLDYDYVEICKIDGQPGHSRIKGVSKKSIMHKCCSTNPILSVIMCILFAYWERQL